jgi:hypothetical protein
MMDAKSAVAHQLVPLQGVTRHSRSLDHRFGGCVHVGVFGRQSRALTPVPSKAVMDGAPAKADEIDLTNCWEQKLFNRDLCMVSTSNNIIYIKDNTLKSSNS